jgi:HSP20 family protein
MAILTRFDPFRDMFRLQDDLSNAFEDRPAIRGGETLGWTPTCDIYEDGDAVTVRVELAGVDPKEVSVRFENGVLTLRGERKLENSEHKENYHRIERSYGSFTRAFVLPGTIDAEKIRADSKNGVLSVVLPKKAELKPRPIVVKVE